MSVVNTLHSFLQQLLPFIHAARLQALMAAVEAGLSGASISITTLGQAVSGDDFIKHKIKRKDRLAGNHHLAVERLPIYAAMASWLLKPPSSAPCSCRLVAAAR